MIRIFISVFFLLTYCNSIIGQTDFVKVNGDHFEINGSDYRYIGINFWSGIHLASGYGGDKDRLLQELDTLSANGINNLRLMVGSEGPDGEPWRMVPAMQNKPGEYNDNLLKGLDFVLDEMAKRNMKAILCLGNTWQWSGGFAQYQSWITDKSIPYPTKESEFDDFMKFTAKFYKNKKALKLYLDFIRHMINRQNSISKLEYKNDPSIMSWELANEPYAINKKHYLKWIENTSALIKSLDPNHLVCIGSEGMTNYPKYTKNEVSRDNSFENIDYITIHIWPQNWNWYDPKDSTTFTQAINKTKDYIHTHLAAAIKLNKPMVLEEFGLARDQGSYSKTSTTAHRDQYFAEILSLFARYCQRKVPFCGINFWAWGGNGNPRSDGEFWEKGDDYTGDPPHEPQGWYSIYSSDKSTLKMIKGFSRMIQAK